MSITDDSRGNGFFMPVAPAYNAGYGNGGGSGFFGGDWAWIILLLLIGGNGWGMGGFGMGGMMMPWLMGSFGGMGGGFGLDYLYPWLNNSQHISDGFRDQYLNTQIGDLRTDVNRGFGDVQLGIAGLGRQVCETGSGITQAVNNGFSAAEIAANGRQMANMQQGFGIQTAIMQGFNASQAQAADCCCKTQTGIADLKYTVATENCADRTAATQNTRDIIDAQTRGTQAILDKLCQLELDGVRNQVAAKDDIIAQLRQENLYARGQASQIDQTARIIQGQNAAVGSLVNELRSCPIPAQPVYGSQPIFTCPNNNNGCGCSSCGGNFR